MKREIELFSLFSLSKANLFLFNDSSNDSFKTIYNFVNITQSSARSLARYILIKSFIIFIINKIDRNEGLDISLIKARLYYRAKS